MKQKMECDHLVDVQIGTRLWCYYDASFGVVTDVGTGSHPWHDFVMDGGPHKAAGSKGYYDAQRLACEPCGVRQVKASRTLAFNGEFDNWTLVAR